MSAGVIAKKATKNRLTLLVVGDGTPANVVPSATLLAAMIDGPLKDLWNAVYADQAAMRTELLEGGGYIRIRPRLAVAAVNGEVSSYSVDVDVDAVTGTKAELNIQMPDTGVAEIYVDLLAHHSIID